MTKAKQSTVRLYPAEREALEGLQQAIRKLDGREDGFPEIVGAMIHGVSVHQLVGMLAEFHRNSNWGKGSLPSESKDE